MRFQSFAARARCLLLTSCAILTLSPGARAEDRKIDEVIVTGYGSQVELVDDYEGGQVARGGRVGIFGNLDLMDTPFSITSYTAKLILDQQAKSVADVLQNDPVVRAARGFGNFQEVYIIRGFPVYSDDMTYNGIYGILPRQYVAAEFLERVEVFRGANSFLNGAAPGGSGIGGGINLVPKRAPDDPLNRMTVGYESEGHLFGAVDVARRFGQNGETGVRANAVYRDGETSVEGQGRQLSVLGLGIDHQGEKLRLSADVGFQDHEIKRPRPSVTPLGAAPEPPEPKSNFAQPWTVTKERQLFAVARAEYDLAENTTVWAAGGTRGGKEYNDLWNPNSDANGDLTGYRFENVRKERVWSGEVGIRSEFETGDIGHRLVLSGSLFSVRSRNAYAFSNFFSPQASNLYDPVDVLPADTSFFTGGDMDDPLVTESKQSKSLAFADMISLFDKRVLLTVGGRYQNIEQKSFDYNSGGPLSAYSKSKLTPMAGLLFKATPQLSVYGSYIQSLTPGEVAPASSGSTPVENAGEIFAPYTSDQYEAGVKYDGGNFGATVAVFTLSKPIAFVTDGVFGVYGSQRHQGIELSVFGQPIESVRLIGGLTVLDPKMRRTGNPAIDGNDPVGVPQFQINLNAEWDVPFLPGLTLDGRVTHTGKQFIDVGNNFTVPSWTRLDLGMRYAFELAGTDVALRARVENVTNKGYWASVGGFPGSNYLVLGNPRTVLLSLSLDI